MVPPLLTFKTCLRLSWMSKANIYQGQPPPESSAVCLLLLNLLTMRNGTTVTNGYERNHRFLILKRPATSFFRSVWSTSGSSQSLLGISWWEQNWAEPFVSCSAALWNSLGLSLQDYAPHLPACSFMCKMEGADLSFDFFHLSGLISLTDDEIL